MAILAELPDGRLLEFPDGTDPRVIQATVKRVLGVADEGGGIGTLGGFLRGLPAGAVNLLEGAAVGASSVLPDSWEPPVRGAIQSTAEALRRPFAGAPGEAGTIARRFGESVGSFAPMIPLGMAGVAGRAAALGLGVGAGAGEARVRAEEGGATEGQKAGATALGAAVGVTEALPVFAFLNRLGADGAGMLNILRRAAVTGGQEGLQEAAANVAQNLIAKGLYNPEQGVFTDTGEALGYGAGTGALVSALTDLVLGRRTRGTKPAEEPPAEPGQPAPEVPPAPETPPPPDAARSLADMSPAEMSLDQLREEEARLSALLDENRRQPPVVKRIKKVRALKKAEEAKAAAAAPAEAPAPTEPPAPPEGVAALPAPVPVEPALAAPPADEPITAASVVTPQMLAEAGLPAKPKNDAQAAVIKWFEENIAGRTIEEIQALRETKPGLFKGGNFKAKILRELDTITPMPFEEREIGRTDDPGVSEPVGNELGGSESGVAVPSGSRPVRRRAAAAAEPATSVPSGVAPAALPAEPGTGPEGAAPASVIDEAAVAPAPAPAVSGPPPRIVRATERLQPYVAPEQATPQAERALQAYVDRMDAEQAPEESFPRYLAWDMFNGSTFDPQTGELTKVGFKPESKAGISAAQARTAFDALNPTAQKEELAEYGLASKSRPTVTETPTGRRVKGNRYQTGTPANGVPLAPEIVEELKSNGLADALNLLAQRAKDPLNAALARRLSLLLGNTKVEIVNDLRNPDGDIPAAGAASTSGNTVWLDNTRGLNEETLLHESVHAASERILATPADKRTAQQNVAVRELNALWDAAKADPDITLSQDANAQLSEFVTEALTNPALVSQLKAKPWKRATAWDQFKRILLKMLGITDPTTMQDAAVAAMDTIFEPSPVVRDAQGKIIINPQERPDLFRLAPDVEAALKSQDSRQTKTVAAMVKGAYADAFGVPGAIHTDVVKTNSRIRTRLSDKAATVFDEITGAMNKGMISAMEAREVKTLFKQAEASDQLIPEFMRKGALRLNKALGIWKAEKGDDTPVEVIEMVEAWGKKNGLNFDDAWQYAARLIESGRQHAFREYNANRKPGEPAMPTTKDFPIDKLYAAYKADADLAAIKAKMDRIRFAMVDNMAAVGRISKADAAEWKAATEYIPFDREGDSFKKFGNKIRQHKHVGRGISTLGRLPELVDEEVVARPVGNALENYFNTLGWMVQQTVRTDATNKTLAALERINVATKRGTNINSIRHREAAVHGYRDGEEVYYELPSIYHVAAFRMELKPLPKILEVFGSISRVLRTTITALPTFTAAQLPQDIQRAILYSGVKNPALLTKRVVADFAMLSKHALRGTLHTVTSDLGDFGIVGDVDFRANDPAKSILEELGYADRKTMGSTKFGSLLHRLNELSRASDIAVRKAIYEQTLSETGDKSLALQRAREIINFRTTGMGDPLGILPIMVQTVPFFNAYVQGTDVLYRALTGRESVSGEARNVALKKFYMMAGSLAAASSIYALMMVGDDDWEEMNLEKRDRSWILGNGVSLPVPTEIGMIFKAIPERVIDALSKQGTPDEQAGVLALSSWFRTAFMEYFGRTVPIPAAAKPVLEAWTGYSFRTGRPLEGIFQQGLDPSARVNSGTSEFAKEVARFAKAALGLEVSPIKIDNTLNGYFGTTIAMTLAATDSLINPNRADRPLHQMVGLTPFTYDPVGTRRISEFYDLREKVVNAQNTLNSLMKQDINRAAAYVQENRERLLMYKAVNDTLNQLSQTRQYKQWLDTEAAARQYPPDERLRRKQEVQQWEKNLVSWTRQVRTALDY